MEVREIARLYPQWVKVEIVCALSPCAVNLDAARATDRRLGNRSCSIKPIRGTVIYPGWARQSDDPKFVFICGHPRSFVPNSIERV